MFLAFLLSMLAHAGVPLPLDRASVADFTRLEHIDEPLAKEIVKLRAARGGHLTSVDELRSVPGMTVQALESLRSGTGIELSIVGASGKQYTTVDQVLGEFAHEPTIQQVQGWTNEYARTSPEMVRAWARASQQFAILPRLQVEYYLREDWNQDFNYVSVGQDLQTTPTSIDEGQDYRILVRSQWDLSELVMSSDRIRVINEAQDAVKLRDKLLSQVTRLFFDRRRHQVEMLLNPRPTLDGQVEDQLRLLELTAGLDALTGGSFSRAIRGGAPN
jgi:hypothetical protein